MRRLLVAGLIFVFASCPMQAHADLFGGDVAVLVQILANALQQLSALRSMVSSGQDSLGLLRDINRGINDSLVLLNTVSPNVSPGLYGDWQHSDDALAKLQALYGIVAPSPDAPTQKDADKSVAEAISLNNSIYDYTHTIDGVGTSVQAYSHATSPGGAQKLTAETLGVMLNVMTESLRAQATGLKLQAQNLAIENKKDKDMTRQMISNTADLQSAMKSGPADFSTPRF
jgi:hypothetical protein